MTIEDYLRILRATDSNYNTHHVKLYAYPSFDGSMNFVASTGNVKGEGVTVEKALSKLTKKLNDSIGQ